MESKKSCTIFSLYSDNENQNGTLRCISLKFLCLSLYVIGFYHVFVNTSLENKGFEIVNISNIYERNLGEAEKNSKGSQRKRNLKLKKEDVNKPKSNGNIKINEQLLEENKYSINHDIEKNNVENKSNSSMNNINYNDLSKNLKEKELRDVLNSLKECPSNEDLRNIWTHTIGIAKEGLDVIQKELKASIQKYLDNDFLSRIDHSGLEVFVYDYILQGHILRIFQAVINEELLSTQKFFSLINNKHTLDDILKFIFSFLEHFMRFKKDLYEYHQKELLIDVEQEWH
ncbi:Plasmodium exported protein (PHISTa), unknown, putative [Plasmodium sp. gorilla clade G1]|nr:Plasmodium exported protein (PHISTa), unknown, putative [Plasmodium sp. gorilla clade G1]